MNKPTKILERNLYISKISPFIDKQIVKVLTGHRRVGKSYILYQLMDIIKLANKSANIIYINKEDIAFDKIRDYEQLNDYVQSKQKSDTKNYIFVDEIQMVKDFHIAVKSWALDENNDIYITGSNSNLLSSDLANELGGRYVEFTIYSLSYLEFLYFHQLENTDESLERYFRYGGLPYLIHLPNDDAVIKEYLSSIYSTIVLKDVVKRKKIRNADFLDHLITFLAGNIGNLFSSKSINDYLKSNKDESSVNQIIEYTNALTEAFIVHRIGRYDIAGKKVFERGEKYYFENIGIRNVIAGYKPQDRTRRLENVVLNHLLYCGYDVKVGTLPPEEIDFICTKNGETIYVQVTVELSQQETIDREFGNLLKIKDNYPKIVVSGERSFENTYEGVEHIYIRNFLSGSPSKSIIQ
ncbi:MAG: ATP-binding protein [Flavobacteriaceae bacterium]|jgi:predicted AAA+ superfamily ATPase|nr:ATP-binding protein [Flavobacteriaceae bacterium]